MADMRLTTCAGAVLFLCLMGTAHGDFCELEGRISQPGEKYPVPDDCGEYTCHANGFLSTQACPYFVSGPPYCELIAEDLSKPYPDCCERYEC